MTPAFLANVKNEGPKRHQQKQKQTHPILCVNHMFSLFGDLVLLVTNGYLAYAYIIFKFQFNVLKTLMLTLLKCAFLLTSDSQNKMPQNLQAPHLYNHSLFMDIAQLLLISWHKSFQLTSLETAFCVHMAMGQKGYLQKPYDDIGKRKISPKPVFF